MTRISHHNAAVNSIQEAIEQSYKDIAAFEKMGRTEDAQNLRDEMVQQRIVERLLRELAHLT